VYRQQLGLMCFWTDASCSRLSGCCSSLGCCCLVRFLSSFGEYYWLVCVDLSVDPGGILFSVGGRRFVWWRTLLSVRLGSDGLLEVLFGWHRRCVVPLYGRSLVSLLVLSFWW